jgi:polyisoprenoid-binding protein YceI
MAWVIDNAHTRIGFSVKHMMITTVHGTFSKFSGNMKLDAENPQKSYVEGTIETASVNTNEDKRDGHLRSADFFDAEKYPVMTFRSTRIELTGKDEFKVVGDITIKDVTREITFNVRSEGRSKSPWGTEVWGLTADTSLNRKDFGLNWNVALETGGWLVGDQVKIHVELEVVNQVEAVAATA